MNPLHILVVDDNDLTSYALKEHLEQEGCQVTLAGGCQEAKNALGGPSKVDVIILDYLLPDGRGTDLFRSMAEDSALQKPNIIMCSSLIDPKNPAWQALCSRLPFGLQSLIRGYATKPYTFQEMDNLILESGDYRAA